MARRKNTSGKKNKTKSHKRKKTTEEIIPLSVYRMRYPDISEEWSPVVISALRRKRVKDPHGGGFRWKILPSTPTSKQMSKKSKEEFEAWKTTFSFMSS